MFVTVGTPVSDQVNLREACRQDVGGAYLKVYDEKTRADDYIAMLKDSLTSLQAAVVDAEKDARAKRAIAERSSYDLDKAIRRDQAQAKLDTLLEQRTEGQGLLKEALTSSDAHAKEEERLRQELSPIFHFERHGDQADGGYPLRINYKSSCPRFRYLCTLPDKDVEFLLRIRIDGALPESCKRYAAMSKLRK